MQEKKKMMNRRNWIVYIHVCVAGGCVKGKTR